MIVFETDKLAFPIKLYQLSNDRFSLVYGKELTHGMNYAGAATALGLAMVHALACEGKISGKIE